MSQPTEKIYVPRASCKEKTFTSGHTVLKLGFHASTLIEFIRANANQRGYINLGISKRREVGQHGDTHCVWLDTWLPGQTAPAATPAQQQRGFDNMRQAAKPTAPEPSQVPPEDDVPF